VSLSNALQTEASLQRQITDASHSLEAHEEKLRALDAELDTYSNQRLQYQLLGTICTSLEKLDEMGASELFWDSKNTGYSHDKQLQRVRGGVAEFESKIAAIETLRSGVQADIQKGWNSLHLLKDELAELLDEIERTRNEFAIVRVAEVLPFRPLLMPWAEQREDKQRYRKIRLIVLFFVLLFGFTVSLLKAPPEKRKEEEIPERLAELVVKKKPEPRQVEQKQTEATTSNVPSGGTKQLTSEQQARASAETKGVLALKGGFADLMGDSSESTKLGSNARVARGGNAGTGDSPQRSVIGSQATGGSGGINTSGLSRQGSGTGNGGNGTGGGGGNGLGGVGFSRVTSNIGGGGGGGGGGDGRPLSSGPGPSRTDEEIQIVFDRYKAALYRIYNRELRTNPLLKGKMMLRISIKPDGTVSLCKLESTNMDSPALVKEVLARVEQFNFGAKAGVPTTTILYPIDFLPAN
jgi:hypothetical protein